MSSLVNMDFGSVVKEAGTVLDNLVTSDEERLQVALQDRVIDADLQKAQVQINTVEVTSGKSWRHWVGRVGAISLGLYFIPQYFMAAVLWTKACWGIHAVNGVITFPPYPASSDAIMQLVTAMLGLGTIKAYEKVKGVYTSSMQQMPAPAIKNSAPWYKKILGKS